MSTTDKQNILNKLLTNKPPNERIADFVVYRVSIECLECKKGTDTQGNKEWRIIHTDDRTLALLCSQCFNKIIT